MERSPVVAISVVAVVRSPPLLTGRDIAILYHLVEDVTLARPHARAYII
jgi:hypothetical protein